MRRWRFEDEPASPYNGGFRSSTRDYSDEASRSSGTPAASSRTQGSSSGAADLILGRAGATVGRIGTVGTESGSLKPSCSQDLEDFIK